MILGVQFFDQFVRLFYEFNVIAFCAITIGLLFVVMGLDSHGNKRFSILGFLMILCGIVVRIADGGTAFMTFVLVFILCAILTLAYLFMTIKSKKAWLIKASTLSINLEIADAKVSYDFLNGLEGVSIVDINPQGHVRINDINFFATSVDDRLILKGKTIIVTSVQAEKIFVKELIPEDVV